MQDVTLEMVYKEVKNINQRITTLEHLLIPEEKLSESEMKELDEMIRSAKAGNATPFSEIKK